MQNNLQSSIREKSNNWVKGNHFNVYPARWKDMDKVCDFIRSTAKWYENFVDEKDMSEHLVNQDWAKKNFELRNFYIGYHYDEPIGTISIQYFNEYAYLGYIYLDSNYVGQGFGHQLMDFAKNIIQKKQYEGMALIAHPEATWACRAYEKYGFIKKSDNKNEILSWENGALKRHYEEGFNLYIYSFANTVN